MRWGKEGVVYRQGLKGLFSTNREVGSVGCWCSFRVPPLLSYQVQILGRALPRLAFMLPSVSRLSCILPDVSTGGSFRLGPLANVKWTCSIIGIRQC